jgi:hypothetical protein
MQMLVDLLTTAPLHVVLIIAIIILYRRMLVLEDRIEQCLANQAIEDERRGGPEQTFTKELPNHKRKPPG